MRTRIMARVLSESFDPRFPVSISLPNPQFSESGFPVSSAVSSFLNLWFPFPVCAVSAFLVFQFPKFRASNFRIRGVSFSNPCFEFHVKIPVSRNALF